MVQPVLVTPDTIPVLRYGATLPDVVPSKATNAELFRGVTAFRVKQRVFVDDKL